MREAQAVDASMLMHRPATIRHRTSLYEDATAIVEAEYAADLSLDDIARRVASSRRQLQRAYAEIGRTTFRDHLTAVRMEKAGDLLSARGLTVREVAHRVGYRQPGAAGARGGPRGRVPPAGAVRKGVPPPLRRRPVGLPRGRRPVPAPLRA